MCWYNKFSSYHQISLPGSWGREEIQIDLDLFLLQQVERWRPLTGMRLKVLVEKLVYLTLILGNCEDNSPCQISGSSTASPLVLQNCWKGWSCFLSLILSPIGAAETDCSSAASSTNLNWNLVEQIGDQRELLGEHDNLRLALAALITHLSFVQHDPAGQGGT